MSTLAISLPRIARHNPLAAIGVVLVSIFVFSALFAPWIAPQDPAHIDLPNRLQTPSAQHWCGTDELGRDILSRLIWGARISLFVGSSVVACSLLLGLIIGSLAGYYGGGFDRFVNVVLMNAFLVIPWNSDCDRFRGLPRPRNFQSCSCAFDWRMGRLRAPGPRTGTGSPRTRICEAARALGAGDFHIITKHILPNIIQPVIVQAAIGMAGAVLAEATMSFLGLGVPPPTASWGSMLNDARSHLFDAPHLVLFPAVTVMFAVLAFNFIGDALRDLLDPRSRIEAGL